MLLLSRHGPAGFGDQTTLASYHSEQIEYQDSSDTQRLDIKKVSGGGTLRGPFYWAGVGDSYFGAVFLPDDPATATLITLRNSIDIPKDPQKPAETTPVDVLGAAVGRLSAPTSARLYVGPKSLASAGDRFRCPTLPAATRTCARW